MKHSLCVFLLLAEIWQNKMNLPSVLFKLVKKARTALGSKPWKADDGNDDDCMDSSLVRVTDANSLMSPVKLFRFTLDTPLLLSSMADMNSLRSFFKLKASLQILAIRSALSDRFCSRLSEERTFSWSVDAILTLFLPEMFYKSTTGSFCGGYWDKAKFKTILKHVISIFLDFLAFVEDLVLASMTTA